MFFKGRYCIDGSWPRSKTPYLDYRIINFAKNNPKSNEVNLKIQSYFLENT